MRAMALDAFGQSLTLHDRPMPTPGPGEVRVRVRAAALNPADLKVKSGSFAGRFLHGRHMPVVLGYDFAGEVEAVGEGVSESLGTPVFGHLPYSSGNTQGSLAEFVVAPVDAVAPSSGMPGEAAAAATAGLTALQALRDKGRLQSGMRVWVNGASGGVGSLAVQIARISGAEVWASCSASKADFVTSLGADHVLDYRRSPLPEAGSAFDVVFDAAATLSYGRCRHLLSPGGAYITTLPSGAFFLGALLAAFSSKSNHFVVVKSRRADLATLDGWLAAGRLKVAVDSTHPFEATNEAFARLASGQVQGKVVVTVG